MPKLPQRLFLPWDRPLVEQAAEWLMALTPDEGLPDLSDLLVIVPTRNAARRLREMLANLAAQRDQAVIPPLCGPPTLLVRPEDGAAKIGRPLASQAEVLAAWIAVLRDVSKGTFRHLFPIEPESRDFSWAQGMAADLVEVRSILGEAGLLMADVARRLPEGHDEKDRWLDLGAIEEQYLTVVRELGRCDPVAARAIAAKHAGLPEGTSRVVVIGTADPFPLAKNALQRLLDEGVDVTVLVYAPEQLQAGFDEWGQPLAEYWNHQEAPIEIDHFEDSVEVFANPDHMHETVVETVKKCSSPEDLLAIGALDAATAPILEKALRDRGFAGFSPEGNSLRSEGVLHFLGTLRDFVSRAQPEAAATLIRTPEINAWLATKIDSWQQSVALRGIDDALAGHLTDDAARLAAFLQSDAQKLEQREPVREFVVARYEMAAAALRELAALRSRLTTGELSETLPEVLREVLSCRVSAVSDDQARPGQAEVWPEKVLETAGPLLLSHLADLSRAVRVVSTAELQLTRVEQLTLAISLLAAARVRAERPPAALELQGWLELLWEDAPHLVVAGLNDGIAPEAVVGHPFLPEGLRSLDVLELKGNAERFARDAYQLTALLESRRDGGRVDLLLTRRSQGGDPMRPSRLLLCCREEQLPARVRHLFREVEVGGTGASWEPGFRLLPGAAAADPLKAMAVTGFSKYLRSPFHFYLDSVLRVKAVEPVRRELNAMEFGNFCHDILETFGVDETARELEDAAAIEKFLLTEAEAQAEKWFGVSPPLAVRVQLGAAMRRMRAVAAVQAAERQNGWQIINAEQDLSDVSSLVINGVKLRGRIDRVDKRDGRVRVLDYKTSDKAKTPAEVHFKSVVPGVSYDFLPDYARFMVEDSKGKQKQKRWTDLQLPLYCLALREKYGDKVEAGYLVMPKAMSETGVLTLPMSDEVLDAAMVCAEGIVADVQAGKFWPLVPQGEWDNYEGMHLGMPELTIDAKFIGGSSAVAEGSHV